MKLLVVLTCIAVFAAVGYFGWREYSTKAEASERQALAESRDYCLGALRDFVAGVSVGTTGPQTERCVRDGALTAEEVAAAKL